MSTTDNESKTPSLSKKWLYGSLAVIALILGIFLDNNAVAGLNSSAVDAVKHPAIGNREGKVNSDATIENSDFNNESLENNEFADQAFANDEFLNDEFASHEDNYMEDDRDD